MGINSAGGGRRSRALLLSSSVISAAMAVAGSALAAGASGQLEEVIVTARKRDENIQNVPVAVTAVSAQKLDNYQLRNIEAISASVPQLAVVRGNSGSGATISMRGVGSSFTSIGIEQSVAVNLDGVYYGQGRILNEGFFDMKQVEILRGPQSLFFGKNATAGVISFRSADPGPKFEAMARAGYEFKGDVASFEGYVSGPITDQIGLRLAVRGTDQSGGYMQNIAPATVLTTLDVANGFAATNHPTPAPVRELPQEKDRAFRLTAKYAPNDQFSLTLKGGYTQYRIQNATGSFELTSCPQGHSQVNPTETCNADRKIQQNDVPPDVAATNPLLGRHGGRLYQDYDAYSLSATASYSSGLVDITSVTGMHRFVNYFLGDYDFTGASNGGTWGSERSHYKAFSEELRAQTTLEGPVNFLAGFLYQTTRLDFDQQIIFPGALSDLTLTDRTKRYITLAKLSYTDGTTFAGFGQAQWRILPTLELNAGARYTHETKDSSFVQPYVVAPFQAVFVANRALTANQIFNNFSPEVTLSWKPTSDVTAFVSYKKGYKAGGFSNSALYSTSTTVNDLAFRPEKAKGWEAGVRTALFERRLRVAVDVYRYIYSDLQVDYFDSAKIQFITANAGSSKVEGVELESEWATPLPGLVVRGQLAYNKAAYQSFAGAPCWGGQTPAQGCTINAAGRAVQDLSGHPTALAPKWTGALEANFDHKIGYGLVLGASGNLKYSDDYLLYPFGGAPGTHVQKAYSTLDASVRLRSETGLWEVAVIGKNLTDKYVSTFEYDAPSSGGNTGTASGFRGDSIDAINLPRTITLQVTLKY